MTLTRPPLQVPHPHPHGAPLLQQLFPSLPPFLLHRTPAPAHYFLLRATYSFPGLLVSHKANSLLQKPSFLESTGILQGANHFILLPCHIRTGKQKLREIKDFSRSRTGVLGRHYGTDGEWMGWKHVLKEGDTHFTTFWKRQNSRGGEESVARGEGGVGGLITKG